ncbi:mas-related G-protein coupled receptor member X2-like [Saccopteryx bilineata]|uniref:mas-related G-protein coupled receptor member X2-like n=1 Tax=Saccopteryx bilineata TaxID=59482 RepID=UPI00338FC0B4
MLPGTQILFFLRVTIAECLSKNTTITPWGTELTPTNGIDQATPKYDKNSLIPTILGFIIALVGLPGNVAVLWLLGFRIRRKAFSVYVLNLAAADFLFLCCYTTYALDRFTGYFSSISAHILHFFFSVATTAYITGLSILSAISTERCLSVLWPIWYRCRRPKHMSAVLCSLLWALSLLLSLLDEMFCHILDSNTSVVCKVIYLITFAWLILLFVILSGSSLALLTRLLCGSQRVQLTQLYVTVMLTVLVFLLCGLPIGILTTWYQHDLISCIDKYLVPIILSCVNSCANPIIYFFVGSFRQRWWKRRQNLRVVLQRALQDTPEVDEHGESPPQETLAMSRSSLVS